MNAALKVRVVLLVIIWFFILGIAVVAYKYWFAPRQVQIAEEQAKQEHQEILDKTSAQSRYTNEVVFNLDAFSGYAGFRTPDFKSECAQYGIKLTLVDDGANYAERLQAMADGKCQMAVFTIDALVKASVQLGDIPVTAICLVDETKGADAP